MNRVGQELKVGGCDADNRVYVTIPFYPSAAAANRYSWRGKDARKHLARVVEFRESNNGFLVFYPLINRWGFISTRELAQYLVTEMYLR